MRANLRSKSLGGDGAQIINPNKMGLNANNTGKRKKKCC